MKESKGQGFRGDLKNKKLRLASWGRISAPSSLAPRTQKGQTYELIECEGAFAYLTSSALVTGKQYLQAKENLKKALAVPLNAVLE